MLLNCTNCGKPVEKSKNYRGLMPFCNQSCATTYRNLNTVYPKTNPVDRFWSYVKVGNPDECWEWIGSMKPQGYGQMQIDGKLVYAHRYSWFIHYGKLDKGIQVHHKCDNRKCVNPNHLWLGVQKENIADMIAKGRQNWKNRLYGENHPMAKLCNEEVEAIKLLSSTKKYTDVMLSIMFGVSQSIIGKITNGKNWNKV